ncbi:hypothetical protein BH11PSE2_BH11PSE2_22460 [soil metagenome]
MTMSVKEADARARQLYTDQFQPDGEGYIYRRASTGPAIAVTGPERDELIERFTASSATLRKWLVAGMITLALVGLVGSMAMDIEADSPIGGSFIGVGLAGLLTGYVLIWRRIYNFPVRILAGRTPLSPPLSRDEARRRSMAALTWDKFAYVLIAIGVFLARYMTKYDIMYRWNRIWIGVIALVVGFLAVRAVQKWRYGGGQLQLWK